MRNNIYLDFAYLILLAASFGAVVVLGAFAAPVIFHTDLLAFDLGIDSYTAGIVMTEIFRRFGYWLYLLAFFTLFYELYAYKRGFRDAVVFGSSATVIFSSLMFSGVYTPRIVAMQLLGGEATKSDTFKSVHYASELDFKILAIALIILFIRRLMLLRLS
ncbi:MAG: DUF4149 domain-containing protein [Sulfuricurvum sp.]